MIWNSMLMASKGKTLETVQSLPAMTSNSAPSGHVASASSSLATSAAAWKAFDQLKTDGGGWLTASGGVPGWLQRQLPLAIVVGRYTLTYMNFGLGAAPKAFELQGSINGSTWTTVDARTAQSSWRTDNVADTKAYDVAAPGSYTYYRLVISESNGDPYVLISELELLQLI